jgi:hypothetical protein
MTTQVERLARVEERVNALENKVDDMNQKLDQLLELRYKGMGAFWLASTLIGTGIVGAMFQLLAWFKGP